MRTGVLIGSVGLAALGPLSCGGKGGSVGCPPGTANISGVCVKGCAQDDDCLLTEVCTAAVCTHGQGSRPVILDLHAETNPVPFGRPAHLQYQVANATSVQFDPPPADAAQKLGVPEGAAWTTDLHAPATFTITAYGPGGRTTRTVDVGVVDMPSPPTIVDFSANPNPVPKNMSTALSWNVEGAEHIAILQGSAILHSDTSPRGTFSFTPSGRTTLTLSATNGSGTSTKELSVDVMSMPVGGSVGIDNFDASDHATIFGANVLLSWSTHSAKSITVTDSGRQTIFQSSDTSQVASGHVLVATPYPGSGTPATLEYQLVASDGSSSTPPSTARIQVVPPPQIPSFGMTPFSFPSSGSTSLTVSWQTVGADSVDLSGNGQLISNNGSPWPVNGSAHTSVMGTTHFRLAAANAAGSVSRRAGAWAQAVDNSNNNSPNTAVPADEGAIINGCSDPNGAQNHWYVFHVEEGSAAVITLSDDAGSCGTTVAGTTLELYQGTQLLGSVSADPLAVSGCPTLDGRHQSFARGLSPANGPYFVHVTASAGLFGCPAYALTISIIGRGCGNGILDPGEECDDGNQLHGDGCSPSCTVEPGSKYDLQMAQSTLQASGGRALTFTPIDPNYPATDEGYASVELPFEFTYFGRTYRTLHVFVNGYATFSNFVPTAVGGDAPSPIPSGTGPDAVIALLWSDLIIDTNATAQPSRITETVEGAAPSRRMIIGYENVRTYDPNNTDYVRYNAQIVLVEGTNEIELRYGSAVRVGTKDPHPIVGIENHQGTFGITLPGCPEGCSLTTGTLPQQTAVTLKPR